MNQLPLNKNELPLIREMLTKYKQGYISGLIPGSNITLTPSGCRNKTISSTGGEGTSYVPPYLKSGGAAWSGTGLVYDVSGLEYYFNGDKLAAATQITLDASDPDYNRFDVVVVNEAGVVSVIQGTASSSPEIPPIPETELMVSVILVEAGSVAPTILSEAIYLDDPTTNWTFSTYTTAPPTGTIIFNGTTTPKQGIHCIEANADQRLGARFVRSTSFDAYQYSMFSVWVRFTSAVAPNNALNVRFENSGGSLVGNTVNLFNFGLQRNIINTWQLVVIPLTSFGSLPSTVKGFRTIMTGGTIGVTRQWDIDYMQLTNGSIPYANVPTIAFQKDGVGVGSASTLNIKEGTNMTITPGVNPISGAVEYEFEATPGGGGQFGTLEFVSASRDLTTSDIGKILLINTSDTLDIELTVPAIPIFSEGDDILIGVDANSNPDVNYKFTNSNIGQSFSITPGEYVLIKTVTVSGFGVVTNVFTNQVRYNLYGRTVAEFINKNRNRKVVNVTSSRQVLPSDIGKILMVSENTNIDLDLTSNPNKDYFVPGDEVFFLSAANYNATSTLNGIQVLDGRTLVKATVVRDNVDNAFLQIDYPEYLGVYLANIYADDVNSLSASATIDLTQFTMPQRYYLDRIEFKVANFISSTPNSGINIEVLSDIKGSSFGTITNTDNDNFSYKAINIGSDYASNADLEQQENLTVRLDFSSFTGGINPQDFTIGAILVVAVLKRNGFNLSN